jgi:two-component system sensor histidine kinase DctS
MSFIPAPAPPADTRRPRRLRRVLPWVALVALLLVAQSLLVMLSVNYEAARAQERVEQVATETAIEVKRDLSQHVQRLQALLWNDASPAQWRNDAANLLPQHHELLRLERRTPQLQIVEAVDTPYRPPLFAQTPRASIEAGAELACAAARRSAMPSFSRGYYVPQPDGAGIEAMDACIPMRAGGRDAGFMVATFALPAVLETAAAADQARAYELSFVEADGSRLARAGGPRGAGVYHAARLVDLPGAALQLRADSAEGRPRLIPNLTTALVLGLSLALYAVVVLLLRDVRKRASAEAALAEALSFRKAMEDSLITGLRARDLEGRITYVNPAFCAMVGYSADELMQPGPPPYWPADAMEEARQLTAPREGLETVFVRKNGERFPVMIYEAPLVDGAGEQVGWMGAVLDISAQRRVEELSRQQQDRLQATARLATMGEMASLVSHELNQPLAAIASYASGSMNMLAQPDDDTLPMVRQAMTRIAEQAERAGRVIKSVHDFVRRREHVREAIAADHLVDAVLPLVRLQARKSGTRIEVDVPRPAPQVLCDRTMLEQVLLNLTRNGIQAMDPATPLAERVLMLRVRREGERRVRFEVADAGPGIAPDVAEHLFTPFFTTRSEGMGLGLSLCRTVIEQHGGALDFESRSPEAGGGTVFRFTLPIQQTVAAATTS